MMAREDFDCVIIGGGVAGLSAAAYLSKAGLKTILFEKNERLGGVAGTFFLNGYTFDAGGTPQYDQLQMLKEFGVDKLVEYKPMGDPAIAMYFPKLTIYGPKEIDDFLAQYRPICNAKALKELNDILFECTKIDMNKYLKLNQAISESKLRFLSGLLRSNPFELIKVFNLIIQNTEDWLKKRTVHPDILFTLRFYNALTMMYPTERTPVLIFVLIMCGLVGKLGGRWHVVKGGNDKFFLAMRAAIEHYGGVVKPCTAVKKIVIEDEAARGVVLEDGEEIKSRYIISNIGIKGTIKHLVGREYFNQKYFKKIESLKPSPSLFKIHLGINKKPPINTVCNFKIGERDENVWWEAIDKGYIPEQPPLLFWCKYLADPSRAPQGKYDIDILTAAPYRHRDGDWDLVKQKERDKIIAVMEEVIPGISNQIEFEDVFTPKDMEKYSGHEEAGILPVEPSVEQLMKFPDISLPIKNLFCIGATVKGGAGVNGAAFTGKLCANKIIKKLTGL